MKIGVLAIQGAVSEHITAVKKTISECKMSGTAIYAKEKKDIENVDALIIPGGESTTISKFISNKKMSDIIIKRASEGMPILGTCAGSIVLAKEVSRSENMTVQPHLLKLIDVQIARNAFGRQRESFESDVEIKGFDKPFHAVFIRAPAITKTWGNCEVLAKLGDKIVMARQGNVLAVAFHPELTDDSRIHEMFLRMIE
ncbi:MAG: pyridoxal 5'-phosphate synthase glutaminase subunit PdxT [Thermoplasmata archaeon]